MTCLCQFCSCFHRKAPPVVAHPPFPATTERPRNLLMDEILGLLASRNVSTMSWPETAPRWSFRAPSRARDRWRCRGTTTARTSITARILPSLLTSRRATPSWSSWTAWWTMMAASSAWSRIGMDLMKQSASWRFLLNKVLTKISRPSFRFRTKIWSTVRPSKDLLVERMRLLLQLLLLMRMSWCQSSVRDTMGRAIRPSQVISVLPKEPLISSNPFNHASSLREKRAAFWRPWKGIPLHLWNGSKTSSLSLEIRGTSWNLTLLIRSTLSTLSDVLSSSTLECTRAVLPTSTERPLALQMSSSTASSCWGCWLLETTKVLLNFISSRETRTFWSPRRLACSVVIHSQFRFYGFSRIKIISFASGIKSPNWALVDTSICVIFCCLRGSHTRRPFSRDVVENTDPLNAWTFQDESFFRRFQDAVLRLKIIENKSLLEVSFHWSKF